MIVTLAAALAGSLVPPDASMSRPDVLDTPWGWLVTDGRKAYVDGNPVGLKTRNVAPGRGGLWWYTKAELRRVSAPGEKHTVITPLADHALSLGMLGGDDALLLLRSAAGTDLLASYDLSGPRWTAALPDAFSGPSVMVANEERVYVVGTLAEPSPGPTRALALDRATGEVLWTRDRKNDRPELAPVLVLAGDTLVGLGRSFVKRGDDRFFLPVERWSTEGRPLGVKELVVPGLLVVKDAVADDDGNVWFGATGAASGPRHGWIGRLVGNTLTLRDLGPMSDLEIARRGGTLAWVAEGGSGTVSGLVGLAAFDD